MKTRGVLAVCLQNMDDSPGGIGASGSSVGSTRGRRLGDKIEVIEAV